MAERVPADRCSGSNIVSDWPGSTRCQCGSASGINLAARDLVLSGGSVQPDPWAAEH